MANNLTTLMAMRPLSDNWISGTKLKCSKDEMWKIFAQHHNRMCDFALQAFDEYEKALSQTTQGKEIISLKAKLANAIQKNITMNKERSEALKAASRTTNKQLEKKNTHLKEQLKEMGKRIRLVDEAAQKVIVRQQKELDVAMTTIRELKKEVGILKKQIKA